MRDDLYEILGIPPEADEKEIRSAYRSLAKKYHPDTGKGSSGERFRAVQRAYDVLGDPERRAAYDHERGRPIKVAVFRSPGYSHHRNASHIDLRHLSRPSSPQQSSFGRQPELMWVDDDPWEDLIAFLFLDF